MDPTPGEVYIVDLEMAAKTRPAVVVSRYDPNRPIAAITFVAITTQYRNSLYEVSLGRPSFLREESWVNVQSVASIDPSKVNRRRGSLGNLTGEQMRKIRKALAYLFDF